MNSIKTDFVRKGFVHHQVYRDGDLAIYERQKTEDPRQPAHFEAIIIQSHNGRKIGEQFIEPSEFYPSDEAFGAKAWSVATLVEAHKKLELVRNHRLAANENAVCAIHV